MGASLLDGDPAQSDRIAELWAGVLENRPRRGWALRVLHATLRDLTAVTAGQLLLSTLVVLIFAVTGWLGGELVFRHGAGVIGDQPTEEQP